MDAKFCATSHEQPNSGCRRRAIMSTRGVMKGEPFAVMRHAIQKRTIRASRIWRPEPESNRRIRICSPLRHHSAIGPRPPYRGSWAATSETDAVQSGKFSGAVHPARSEEHTSELQSLMRISYAVFCLKKKKK